MNLESFFAEVEKDWGFIGPWALLLAAFLLGFIIHKLIFGLVGRWSKFSSKMLFPLINTYMYKPTQLIVLVLTMITALPFLNLFYEHTINHILSMLLIGVLAYSFIQFIGMLRELLLKKYDVKNEDNLHARKIYTQFRIVERIIIFLTVILAISVALMTFDKIRQVGISLLASAGIVGVIVGFAAQKSLGTLLAGIQIAFTQPIRIDDVVIMEGEWGRVEEINLTYVVLRLWDDRRLVVPINFFIEKPFQNWTRVTSELTGTVLLYLDYSAPLDVLREEFQRLIQANPLWDKRTAVLQVTNLTEKIMEVRMLVSSTNSGKNFDLRCYIRENMITFLQKHYPSSLPKMRIDIENINTEKGSMQLFK